MYVITYDGKPTRYDYEFDKFIQVESPNDIKWWYSLEIAQRFIEQNPRERHLKIVEVSFYTKSIY